MENLRNFSNSTECIVGVGFISFLGESGIRLSSAVWGLKADFQCGRFFSEYKTLIFQFPRHLELCSQLPIYQVAIDPWFQIYKVLEFEGISIFFIVSFLSNQLPIMGNHLRL